MIARRKESLVNGNASRSNFCSTMFHDWGRVGNPSKSRFSAVSRRPPRSLIVTRQGISFGYPIGEVRTLLRLADERKRPCAEVRVVAEAHLKACEPRSRTSGGWRGC